MRAELRDGAHPGRHRFREEDLAERFDVGRHTIRSALRLLLTFVRPDFDPASLSARLLGH